jgi:hypothetical protein
VLVQGVTQVELVQLVPPSEVWLQVVPPLEVWLLVVQAPLYLVQQAKLVAPSYLVHQAKLVALVWEVEVE